MTLATTLIGRSSSHFTRTARIFAEELGVEYAFDTVPDLMVTDRGAYAGNPGLRIPIMKVGKDAWFGTLNICRELARMTGTLERVVWPEDLVGPDACNAQELVLQAMGTEVTWIMIQAGDGERTRHTEKLEAGLREMLHWLDEHIESVLPSLPPHRALSFLEVTLFCLVTHLPFRKVLPTEPYAHLRRFATVFGTRPAAAMTRYRFDTTAHKQRIV